MGKELNELVASKELENVSGRSLKQQQRQQLEVALHTVPCVCVSLRYIHLLPPLLCSMVINEQPSTTAAA